MINNNYVKAVEALGLTEQETRVYLAALALGPTSIAEIAKTSATPRTRVYIIVQTLQEKGLMRVDIQGLKRSFAAESPENLRAILEERKNVLEKILPNLLGQFSLGRNEDAIKYYKGVRAARSVYENIIKEIRPRDYYLVISNSEKFLQIDSEYFGSFLEKRARLNLDLRLLLQNTASGQDLKRFEKNYGSKVKLLRTSLDVSLLVTPQRVVLLQMSAPISTLVIENRSTIKLLKELFEIIWNSID